MKDKVALALFGVVVALIISELYLRLFFPLRIPVSGDVAKNQAISYQPSIFSRHIIEAKPVVLNIKSLNVKYHINSLGYRGGTYHLKDKKESVGLCFMEDLLSLIFMLTILTIGHILLKEN